MLIPHRLYQLCHIFDFLGSQQAYGRHHLGVALWHKIEVRWAPWLGRPIAALPTFAAECRVRDAFETRRGVVLKDRL